MKPEPGIKRKMLHGTVISGFPNSHKAELEKFRFLIDAWGIGSREPMPCIVNPDGENIKREIRMLAEKLKDEPNVEKIIIDSLPDSDSHK